MLRDQAREVGRRAKSASVDLGKAERGVGGSHDHVGVARDADPAAEAESVDRRDDGNFALVDGCERRVASAVHADDRLGVGLELLDVDAGAESLTLRADDHDPDLGIGPRRLGRAGQGEPAGHVQRVDRRNVDDDLGDAVGVGANDAHARSF